MRVLFVDSEDLAMCAEVYNANEVRDINIKTLLRNQDL